MHTDPSRPSPPSSPPADRSPFEHPKFATWLLLGLVLVCLVLFGLDAAYEKHGHFAYEDWFGFHAFAGFGAYSLIVLSAKLLRRWLKRPEDYYD